ERSPATAVVTTAAIPVTANDGSEAMIAASGNAGRGQGVKRTNATLVMIDATPMVIAAWKKAQTVRPASANTAYGTPDDWTLPRPLNATTKAISSARGWNTSQSGPSIDCLYLTLKSRAARTRITEVSPKMSRSFRRRFAGTMTRSTGSSSGG